MNKKSEEGMKEQFIIFITVDKWKSATNNNCGVKKNVDEPEADINKSLTKKAQLKQVL